MNLTYFVVHHELSDEAAQLCELLNDLAFAFECQHLAQTRRYYEALRDIERSCHNGPLDLFAGDDAQFSIPCRPHAHPPPPHPFVDDGRGGPTYLHHHHRVQRAHRGAGARPRPACRR